MDGSTVYKEDKKPGIEEIWGDQGKIVVYYQVAVELVYKFHTVWEQGPVTKFYSSYLKNKQMKVLCAESRSF